MIKLSVISSSDGSEAQAASTSQVEW